MLAEAYRLPERREKLLAIWACPEVGSNLSTNVFGKVVIHVLGEMS